MVVVDSPQPLVSVVIPTYDRLAVLAEVLSVLDRAEPPPGGFEVVVVSDGSTDGTDGFLAGWSPSHPFRWTRQENTGPAGARNRGARLARGRRILFLGDDTVPAPDLVAIHAARALREPDPDGIAVLGYTTWHPRMRTSPFLEHINENGLQFGYSIIPDPQRVPFNFFYTSNVSLPAALFDQLGGFDEDFPAAAWEDIELAYRAERSGMRMVYEPAARCSHDHPTRVASFVRRQRKAGLAAVVFARKHPELHDWLGLPCVGELRPRWLRALGALGLRIGEQVPFLFSARLCDDVMRQAYLEGVTLATREVDGADTGAEPDTR